jgi:DNA ligase (NAD+)
MTKDEAKAELKRLAKLIAHYDHIYYNMDKSEISDEDYDDLRRQNDEIEKRFPDLRQPNSPSYRIGSPVPNDFRKVQHKVPMLSLNNAFSFEDVKKFIERIQNFLKRSDFIPLMA